MNNIRASIDVLFRKISPDKVFKEFFDPLNSRILCEYIWRDKTSAYRIFDELLHYSHDEIHNIWNKIDEDWAKDRETDKRSVFGLLYEFSKEVLIQDGNSVCVDFKDLLRWRELSLLIGEDLLTTCFLSQRDRVSRHKRSFFSWSPILTTNNYRLKQLLKKGTAENHFHLGGSAPHSDISWIALMNSITGRKDQFKDFLKKGKLSPTVSYSEKCENSELYILTIKACYIRLFLFYKLNKLKTDPDLFNNNVIRRLLKPDSNSRDSLDIITKLTEIQGYINSTKHIHGKRLSDNKFSVIPDYCISKSTDISNINGNVMLSGERQFMYKCFRAYFSNDKDFMPYTDLFYSYLLIKSKFREEMIQLNKNVGFANFANYQDRKDVFVKNSANIYRFAITNMAVNVSCKNQAIQSIEARVKPKSSKESNISTIRALDNTVRSEIFSNISDNRFDTFAGRYNNDKSDTEFDKHFYVTHFIKKGDKDKNGKLSDDIFSMRCRDMVTRKGTEDEARAIIRVRSSLSRTAQRIRGIDAASSELDCRPEAFAQAYRYIKYHRLNGELDHLREEKNMPVLRATFHAGEDFYDIVDGLRAIDEAIKFLNLDDGDRLGHAIALGLNVRDYYESKHYDLMLPKQWHLDNIVWLISRINKYNLHQYSTYTNLLKNQFYNLFNEIYDIDDLSGVTPDLYYEAWKLRGDDPYMYRSGKYIEYKNTDFWQRCAKNELYPGKRVNRNDNIVNKLYYHYHFNTKVKKNGYKMKRFVVEQDYINIVTDVQRCYQRDIAERHIGIETNPSSNYLIGTFKRYDKHPILQFFNLGLESNYEKIDNCPQLFVSINTDDQGVFNTYLENEYALMALALEKMKDEKGNRLYKPAMIYDWLDRIRQMGLEISFGHD